MQGEYIAPEFEKEGFHCPTCDVYAQQHWSDIRYYDTYNRAHLLIQENDETKRVEKYRTATCSHCKKFSFWFGEKLIHPSQITAPRAHDDMPEPVSEYYNEAREVSPFSPRAAAALLRIAIKKLCEWLGEDEPNLNRAIGKLRQKGLPQDLIDSLDIVRIVGNEGGAHEGQIDLSGADNKDIVDKLFRLVNFIVEKTVTDRKIIEDLFSSLPEDKKRGVEQRDKNNDDSATP